MSQRRAYIILIFWVQFPLSIKYLATTKKTKKNSSEFLHFALNRKLFPIIRFVQTYLTHGRQNISRYRNQKFIIRIVAISTRE